MNSTTPQRIIVSGGGTGGHIFPALAIAQAFQQAVPGCQVLFVGAQGGMEVRLATQAGLPLRTVTISGLYRQLTLRNLWRNLQLPYKLVKSRLQARAIVRQFRPQIAVGTGGYASYPILNAAQAAGALTAVQEQNAFPGLTNRRLADRAALVCLGNAAAASYFPAHKTVLTGNPIRATLLTGTRDEACARLGFSPSRPVLVVTGGSLGARTLNNAVSTHLAHLRAQGVQVLWQTGRFYFKEMLDRHYKEVGPGTGIQLVAFIDDMATAYSAANLVVCRAGALTLAELSALGKPALLVPSPNVAGDHQTANARSVAEAGAGEIVPDAKAEAELVPRALALLLQPDRLAQMQANTLALARPNAAADIVSEILARYAAANPV
jgi:UDP-N-acetylglucosamine--N-acetylmuramyl-(pentapeptide) pyrophosphoryl-undecaprenol N-acetylglucosamine transferase